MITTTRHLLTDTWTDEVTEVEHAIQRFAPHDAPKNDCHVAFFEVARDPQLHVNVTHKHLTAEVSGWFGPAERPEGFVHNRRFEDTGTPRHIVRHIRDMVFAAAI